MGTSARLAGPHAKDRVEPKRLAEEQAALRRVATLVARGASSTEVFAAVAQEVAQVLQLPNAAVCRYDDEGTIMTVIAVSGATIRMSSTRAPAGRSTARRCPPRFFARAVP
jgi:uncharacterized protein YoaH (UPF0181 family)